MTRTTSAVAAAAVVAAALGAPAVAAPAVADVRLTAATAVTVVTRGPTTFEFGRYTSGSAAPAYGVFVTGPAGLRTGVLYDRSFTTRDATLEPYLVPMWVADDERVLPPDDPTSPLLRRTYGAGTYTLYGLGGHSMLRVSSPGGLRVARTVATPKRRMEVSRFAGPVTAGVAAPVWEPTRVRAFPGARVVVVAQQFRDVIGMGGPQRVATCLSSRVDDTCATDGHGTFVYGHGQAQHSDGRRVDLLHCLHYYDHVKESPGVARAELASVGPVREVFGAVFVWEPPAGA